MANFSGLSAAGKSVERFLALAFLEEEPLAGVVMDAKTKVVLARPEDYAPANSSSAIGSPALSILVYRVDFNKTLRAAWSAVGSQDGHSHLPVDLHFLLTPWADNAEFELLILGRAMQSLESTPILSGPLLHPSGEWAPNETIQVLLEDLSTEAVMRTFDSLPGDYRLSVPYLARIVRLDGRSTVAPTVTTVVRGLKPT